MINSLLFLNEKLRCSEVLYINVASLNFSYNYKNTPIDAFNYYQNNVLNSFRSLFNGINQFYNFGASNFSINYSYNDFTDKYLSFNIQSNYIFSKQGFIYENFFENNFYITRQLFFDGFKNYGLNFNVKKFVPSVSTSFSASYGLNSRDYFNKVGSQINEYTGTSQTLSLKGDTGFDFPVNFNMPLTDPRLSRLSSAGGAVSLAF